MSGVFMCLLSLGLANFGLEWFRDVPSYFHAAEVTWSQMWALIIYYFLWVGE